MTEVIHGTATAVPGLRARPAARPRPSPPRPPPGLPGLAPLARRRRPGAEEPPATHGLPRGTAAGSGMAYKRGSSSREKPAPPPLPRRVSARPLPRLALGPAEGKRRTAPGLTCVGRRRARSRSPRASRAASAVPMPI